MLLLTVVALTGCATNDDECRSFGAVPGTDAYVNCMTGLAQRDATNSASISASVAANNAAAQQRVQTFINSGPVALPPGR